MRSTAARLAREPLPVAVGVAGARLQLALHLVGELAEQVGRQQPLLQSRQHALLDLGAEDGAGVGAGALALVAGAAVAIVGDDRIAAAAEPADQQPGKQEAAAVRPVERVAVLVAADLDADHLLPLLHPLPEVVTDDAQLRHLDDLPMLPGVHPGDALAGARVLDVRAAVPLQAAGVEGVVEQAGAAIDLPPDRRIPPGAAVGAGHALGVEPLGDGAGTLAAGERLEDPDHDRRLGRVDRPLAARPFAAVRDDVVAVGATARDLALQRPPQLTATRLLAEIGEGELGQGAEHADVQRRDLAGRQRHQLDAEVGEQIMQLGDVGELAADAVERLADDDVEGAALGIPPQLLETRPEAAGAADGGIRVRAQQGPALAGDQPPADLELVLDRRFALVLAGVSGIDDGAHQLSLGSGSSSILPCRSPIRNP